MSNSIVVVIPFYQKQTGILAKAVRSALMQEGVSPVIYVIDDASPVSARNELTTLMQDHPGRIVVIEQSNGGPAAARNRGLDEIPADTAYVAYLDSDDEWIPTHLVNAMLAMKQGYDFYFSDHYQLNQTISAFRRASRIEVESHPLLKDSEVVHAYQGDMFAQILSGNIIGTSTVVYRFAKFPNLRFREEFVYAGEDYLFWLDLASKATRIAFSSECECIYGPGVNIFAGSGWGTEKSLIRLHYEIKFKKALPVLYSLNEIQRFANASAVKALRRSFIADLVHRISHRKEVDRKVLRAQFKVDPQTFWFALPLAVSIVRNR